ncbi:MAG: hypothetical protein K2H18_02415, partial [Muribaculaceae bacterium]|nr:hypothetical protein [Muribaculaceae bacterium]
EYAVLKFSEEGNAVFKSTENFTSFEILTVDHTPAAAEECSYVVKDNGDLEFSFKAPMLNIEGSNLYEVEGVKVMAGEDVVAEGEGVAPGETGKITVSAPAAVRTRAEEPAYSIVLHNLSGTSEPVKAVKSIASGINSIDADTTAGKLYLLNGTVVEKNGNLAPGLYIEVKNGKAYKVIIK